MKKNYNLKNRWRNLWLLTYLLVFLALIPNTQKVVAQQIVLGTQLLQVGGSTGTPTPYNLNSQSRRVQFIYTAAELTAAGAIFGNIRALAWDVAILAGGSFTDYQIRMANVTETNVAAHNAATLTTVRSASTLAPGNVGWYNIPLTTNFAWDGTSNLLVDVCWGVNAAASGTGTIWMYNNVASQRRGINNATVNQCAVNTTTTANNKPRVRLTFDLPDCAGTPTGGTATATATTICTKTSTLSVTSSSDLTTDNFTFLWEQSINGGVTWTPASGTNNEQTYFASGLTQNTRFRRTLICTAGGASATSSEVEVAAILPAFAILPYTQNFNDWQTQCANSDIPGTSWFQTPSPTDPNASWRRQDQGATAGWAGSLGIVTPFEGVGAANFHSYDAAPSTNANLDVYVNLVGTNAANPKKLTFYFIDAASGTDGSDKLEVLVSTDGGATFTLNSTYNNNATWDLKTITLTGGTANSIIRFTAYGDFGNNDIGIDDLDIVETFPCNGTPVGGTASGNPSSFCGSGISDLSVSGSSADTQENLTFLWQSSTDGGVTWGNAAGTINQATYTTVTLNATTQFRRQITCTNGGASNVSSVVTISNFVPTYATLPYTQNFEVWQDGCDDNDVPSQNFKNTPATGNTSWRRQDQGVSTGGWDSNGGAVTLVAANATGIARFHSYDASSSDGPGNLDLFVNLSSANPKKLSFAYRNSGGSDSLQVQLSEDGGLTFGTALLKLATNTAWTTSLIDLSSTSATAVIRFRAVGDFGFSDIGLDNISLTELLPCAGLPLGGTISTTFANLCLGVPVLSVAGSSDETNSGFTYLWQASTDGGTTWNNALGTNNQKTYTVGGIAVNTRYRRQIICTASTQSAPSTDVEVTVPYAATYATLPYSQDFNAWINGCATSDVPTNNWKNTPATGNNSWRRQNDGTSALWSFLPTGIVTPFEGAGAANFHTYGAGTDSQGTLDLYVNTSGTAPDLLTFYYQNATGTDKLEVLQSADGGLTFTLLATFGNGAWAKKLVFLTANSATTVIRFRATSDFGNDDIGIDELDVEEIVPCAGTPTAGIAVTTPTSTCEAPTAVISVIDGELRDGLTYQWQSSLDNATWADIIGATNETYTTPAGLTASTWYRRVTTCALSSESAPSTSVRFEVAYTITPVTLPYTENFEASWVNGCATKDIPSTSWRANPVTGNDSWRKSGEEATAGWFYLQDPNWAKVTPFAGSGAATYHSYTATADTDGDGELRLFINASTVGTKLLNFQYSNSTNFPAGSPAFLNNNTDQLEIAISENGGTSFTVLATLGSTGSSNWIEQSIEFNATAASTIVRFRTINNDFAGTDIGIDNLAISVIPACAGIPTAGTTVASPAIITCPGSSTTLTVTGSSIGTASGLTYQWESSPDGVTWTTIIGATSQSYSTVPTATTQYRRIISCGASSATSAPVTVTLNGVVYATLPYNEGFEAWGDKCADQDVPSINWVNTPVTGNNSWRRQNEGATASWTDPLGQIVTPFSGTGAANFHSWFAGAGTIGNLDLYINASTIDAKRITFSHINVPDTGPFATSAIDFLRVLLSTNGGATFNQIAEYGETGLTWENRIIDFSSNSANTVIRFQAVSDFGTSDIGIDALQVLSLPTCTGTLLGGTASALAVCVVPQTVKITGASDETSAGFTYQWEQSINNGVTWTNATGVSTNATYSANPTVTTQYRRVITCTASTASATSTVTTLSVVTPIPAILPYTQTFESSWLDGCDVNDLPDLAWKNTPITGSNSWRRQNEGASAEWDFLADLTTFPQINANPVSGTGAAVFHSWGAEEGLQGTLDLFINASAAGAKKLKFSYINADVTLFGFLLNTDVLEVFESNDGITFTSLGTLGVQNTWKEFSYDLSVTSANAVIRFRATSDFGSSNLGIDNVNIFIPTPCAGVPNAGSTVASTTDVCIDASPELSVNGSSDATQLNFTYQWQQSIDGGVTWTDIAGATNAIIIVSPTVTTQYRRALTCTNSTQTATSVPVEIEASPILYAPLPFEEGFESWGDLCANQDVPLQGTSIYWKNTPATGNNSWRRQNEGATAGWLGFQGDLLVTPINGTGSAVFHTYSADVGEVGTLDLFLNVSSVNQKVLKFLYSNPDDNPDALPPISYTDILEVQISFDGGVTFSTLATLENTPGESWVEQTILFTQNSPNTIIRFKATSDFGGSNIAIDKVQVLAPFPFDVGVTNIALDRCSPVYANVVVTIENFGTETITSIPVSFTYNGTTYNATWTGTLAPLGGTATYVFGTPINVSGLTSVVLISATALANDGDATNNSFSGTIGIPAPLTLPYTENFNTGFPAGWEARSNASSSGWVYASPNPPNTGGGLPFPARPNAYTNDIDIAHDGSNFMATDDDVINNNSTTPDNANSRNGTEDYLITPSFDFSNYTNLQLTFSAFTDYSFGGNMRVEVSLDNGVTWQPVAGGVVAENFWSNYTVSLAAYNGLSNVKLAFHYDDEGEWATGVAIDNVSITGTSTATPQATVSTPAVPNQFVLVGTDAHVVYQLDVTAAAAKVTVSDIVLKTAGTYDANDIVPNSFRLWSSEDATLTAGDLLLAQKPVIVSGGTLVFNCIDLNVELGKTAHLFLTVDVTDLPNATVGNTINIAQPNLATDFIVKTGNKTGTLVAGGVQTIALPNTLPVSADKVIDILQDETYTFVTTDFAFTDPDLVLGNTLQSIRIGTVSIPTGATLTLNGVPVAANTLMTAAQIPSLSFKPAAGAVGNSYASFSFEVFDGRDYSNIKYLITFNVLLKKIGVPELFTPNGDDKNELFKIYGSPSRVSKLSLKILDRNNNIVFETSDISAAFVTGWDGKNKDGKEQPTGVYVWYLEGTYIDGNPLDFAGKRTGVIRLVR